MEEINNKKTIKTIIISVIAIIIIITIIIIILTNINTKNFKNYVEKNYETNPKKTTYYTVYNENYILTKTTKLDKKVKSLVSISINKKGVIEGKLNLFGENKYGYNGVSYLKSTYNNKKFDCEFVSNDGYTARCDILKEKTKEFEKEIKKIYKKSKTTPIFINPNQK